MSPRRSRHARLRFLLGVLALTASLLGDDEPTKKYELRSMSPEQLDKDIAGQKRYDFDIAPEDGLIDSTGKTIRAAELPQYLKTHALAPDAAFFLWITPTSAPLTSLAPTVKSLGDYGITKVVVRHRPEAVTDNRNPPPTAPETDQSVPKKTLILQGKPNPGAIDFTAKFPSLEGRPAELRPDPLPHPVRYKFASDQAVIAAAQRTTDYLLSASTPAETLFGRSAMIQSGAWTLLQDMKLSLKAAKVIHNSVHLKRGTITLASALVSDAADLTAVETTLRQLIQSDGGGKVRALHAAEMAKWWVFIAFDIEEPSLVLETIGGKYCFVLSFTNAGLSVVDKLNTLPDPRL